MSITTRQRARAAAPSENTQAQATQEEGWYDSGEDGFTKSETMKSSRKYQPQRFWLRAGEEADLIILDEGKGFFIHEYEIYTPSTKRMSYETVRPDTEYDPLQALVGVDARIKDPSYVMYLTVIDLREFTDKNGNVRQYSKKLLPIKRAQHKKFKRYLEQHGTFRGMMIRMIRDDEKQAKIGDPEFMMADPEAGKALWSDDDLIESFGHDAVKGQDGKTVVKQENEDCYAYDYKTILAPRPSEELARMYNAPLATGSEASNRQMMNTASTPAARPSSSGGSIMSRRRTSTTEEATEVEQEEEAPKSPARTASRRSLPTKSKQPEAVADDSDEVPFDTDDDSWDNDE